MKVAIFGCLHGMLNEMYQTVMDYERKENFQVDCIIVCGDCQTIRHTDDLRCMAVPNRYKQLGDFHEYYSGKKQVPKLTIFVGGNHEASNYLMTLPYGGWVCDNFYYLGYAGVIRYRGLRIAGISGIYNRHDADRGRYECMPLDYQSIKSIYHTRRLDVLRLQLLGQNIDKKKPIDIFLSHDWPARVYEYGDKVQLLRFKPHFKDDMNSPSGLGNPLTEPLVHQLMPRRWFAAHLHCRFYARIEHSGQKEDKSSEDSCTEFLSLNKIEKGRKFVEYMELGPVTRIHLGRKNNDDTQTEEVTKAKDEQQFHEPEDSSELKDARIGVSNDNVDKKELRQDDEPEDDDDNLYYDAEWLTILRKTIELENSSWQNSSCSDLGSDPKYLPTDQELQETRELMIASGGLKIKKSFKMSEPVIYDRPNGGSPSVDQTRCEYFSNPQHDEFCQRLKIESQLHQANKSSSSSRGDDCYKEKPDQRARIDNQFNKRNPNRSYGGNYHRDRKNHNQNYYRNTNSRGNSYSSHNRGDNRRGRRNEGNRFNAHMEPRQSVGSGDVDREDLGQPAKKLAFEVDEDGCLPYFVDRKGES